MVGQKIRAIICIALAHAALSACDREHVAASDAEAEGANETVPLLSAIEARSSAVASGRISVTLRWSMRNGDAASAISVLEAPPVGLFNQQRRYEPMPTIVGSLNARGIIGPGETAEYEAIVTMPEEDWIEGCWQTAFITGGSTGAAPIECINRTSQTSGA